MKRAIIGVLVREKPERFDATLSSVHANTRQKVGFLLLPDGPTSEMGSVISVFSDLPKLVIKEPHGIAASFNRLITYDNSDVIIFLESGSIVTPGWLDALLDVLNADPSHGLTGPSTNQAWNEHQLSNAQDAKALA